MPFASVVGHFDDCFLADNWSESCSITSQHVVSGIRLKPTDVDVGCSVSVVQDLIQSPAPTIGSTMYSRDGGWDGRFFLSPCPEVNIDRHTV